jgi:glycosyltransferase involved in cell wall biosynthesis
MKPKMISGFELQTQSESALHQMRELLEKKRYDEFIRAESNFYSQFIRVIEMRDHHEKMFRRIDPVVTQYGMTLRKLLGEHAKTERDGSVCYFLPSLDNDLAHIVQLATLLSSIGTERLKKTYIAGFTANKNVVQSRCIAVLAKHHGVTVIPLQHNHDSIVAFSRWFLNRGVGLFVQYSIPTLLSAWLELFGHERVAWFVTKFELNSFARLRHGLSGSGLSQLTTHAHGTVIWRRATAALPAASLLRFQPNPRGDIKMVSINREQKIKDPIFLSSICRALETTENTKFYWTGRSADPEIVAFFRERHLEDRQLFIGWVDPTSALKDYDIFLDTFSLSGVVAVTAFSSGMPSLFMRGSNSWLEAFEEEILRNEQSSSAPLANSFRGVIASSPDDYVTKIRQLVSSVRDGQFDGSWQRDIGSRWFFNHARAANQHEQALDHILHAG